MMLARRKPKAQTLPRESARLIREGVRSESGFDQRHDGGRPVTSVMPWRDATPGHPWILKMLGDVARPDSIVLTRRHFVRCDAATRPAGSMLQALLLTRHLLFVGASLNDDNVSRLNPRA